MINESKPPATSDTKLDIGSAFNLLVGGVYTLLIGIGGGGLTNNNKTSIGETWDSIESTWDTETRTWLRVSQLITNTDLAGNIMLWSERSFPWQTSLPWQSPGGIINESKP